MGTVFLSSYSQGLKNANIFCVFPIFSIYIDVGYSRESNWVGKLFKYTHKYSINGLEQSPIKGAKMCLCFWYFSLHPAVGRACRVYLDTNGLKNRSIIFWYMYIGHNTTSMHSISSCGVVVRQDWSGEGVGMVGWYLEIYQNRQCLRCCREIHTVGGPKCESSIIHWSNASQHIVMSNVTQVSDSCNLFHALKWHYRLYYLHAFLFCTNRNPRLLYYLF